MSLLASSALPLKNTDIPPHIAHLSPSAYSALEINLAASAQNYKKLSQIVWPAACSAVLKADGYGVGAIPVAEKLHKKGCRDFFVAYADEGIALRNHFRTLGIDGHIYVLNGFFPGNEADFIYYNLIPTLTDLDQIRRWQSLCLRDQREYSAILHVDTGMSRTGLPSQEIQQLYDHFNLLEGINIRLIISQMAYSDDSNPLFNQLQKQKFDEILSSLPPAPASLAKSGTIFLSKEYHYNMTRPGIALHGINPTSQSENPLTPVVSLWAKIYQVQPLSSGQSVGYNRTFISPSSKKIATLAIGYADGYPWALANTGYVLIAGHKAPIIGRISMDLITIDITHIPETVAYPGAWVKLIGDDITVERLAADAKTVPYELLLRLGKRFQRVYTDSESTFLD